ncbi:MAG: hypothetical protein IJ347_08605 [Faecalibacterium sp.]|nr:hypothetical protein [Faecalibacterium sp.]
MKPWIIAHRGVSLDRPENTIPAFQAAVQMGLDGVETDVQLTRDGKLVLHHNYTIDACSNGSGAISEMDYHQLRSYDYGSYAGEQWRGTTLPNLQEFWAVVKEMPMVNIELKAPIDRSLPYVETVVQQLVDFGPCDNVIISAFDHSLLARVKQLCPQCKVGALVMPAGFAKTKLFGLMERYFPVDRLLVNATRDDLRDMPLQALVAGEVDIPGRDARDAVAELARQIGAVYPQATVRDAERILAAQADLPAYIAQLEFEVEYLHCHYSAVLRDSTLVQRMQQMGVQCNVWTPDRKTELDALVNSGCSGIITNRPDLLVEEGGLANGA